MHCHLLYSQNQNCKCSPGYNLVGNYGSPQECQLVCPVFSAEYSVSTRSGKSCRCQDGRQLTQPDYCGLCPAGQFSTGGAACQKCAIGFTSSKAGATSCVFSGCPLGSQVQESAQGQKSCQSCGPREYGYLDARGIAKCGSCPSGSRLNT